MEATADARKVEGRSSDAQKVDEVDKRFRGHSESLRKVPRTHQMFMGVDGMSHRCTES